MAQKLPLTIRVNPTDLDRAEQLAARINLSRSSLCERALSVGLDELQQTAEIVRSPMLGTLLQVIAAFGDEATAEEFKAIRKQLMEHRKYVGGVPDLFTKVNPT